MTVVVDASVVAELLLGTVRGAAAAEHLGDHDLIAPSHLTAEVASVVREWALGGHLDSERALVALAEFEQLGVEQIDMIGKAVITRFICGKPFDNIQGERVIYRQKTGTYQAFGGPNSAAPGGRVRSLATPRARADAAIEACRKKQG